MIYTIKAKDRPRWFHLYRSLRRAQLVGFIFKRLARNQIPFRVHESKLHYAMTAIHRR